MAYKVLYRKYRPQNFNDLYGQDSIKEILKDSIINNKLAHAYCFNGPRGTGKTSTAKLFAKAINCENAKDGIACGECNSCKNFNENPDIIEIAAAPKTWCPSSLSLFRRSPVLKWLVCILSLI